MTFLCCGHDVGRAEARASGYRGPVAQRMKAVRVDADGSVSVVEMPTPRIGPGEALLRTCVAGICGSALIDWYVRMRAGTILGHEVAGELVAVGLGVAPRSPGRPDVPAPP